MHGDPVSADQRKDLVEDVGMCLSKHPSGLWGLGIKQHPGVAKVKRGSE